MRHNELPVPKPSNTGSGQEEDLEGEGEENKENSSEDALSSSDEADRCPICLNCLLEQEVAFPDNCCHVFCLACILKWAETATSCPVDRKHFQAVYKRNTLHPLKIQLKQVRQAEEKTECNCERKNIWKGKMQSSTCSNCATRGNLGKGKTYKLCEDSVNKCRNKSLFSKRKKKTATTKIKNEAGGRPCSQQCVRSNFYNFPFADQTGGSIVHRNCCTEVTDLYENELLIRQKRRRLESPWLSAAQTGGVLSDSLVSCEVITDVLPWKLLMPRTTSLINPVTSGNFESLSKKCGVTCTQEGAEKKRTPRVSGAKGSRNKSASSAPRRRSARNKSENFNQSQSSQQSNQSGSDAPESNDSPMEAMSSEKSKRQATKRRAKRNGNEELSRKKNKKASRISSKSSASVDPEDNVDTDDPDLPLKSPLSVKEENPDTENNNASLPVTSSLSDKDENLDSESSDACPPLKCPPSKEEKNSDSESSNPCHPLKLSPLDKEENSDAENSNSCSPFKSLNSDKEENSDAESNNACPLLKSCSDKEGNSDAESSNACPLLKSPHSDKEGNSDAESSNACPLLKSPRSDKEGNSDAENSNTCPPLKSPCSDQEENSDAENSNTFLPLKLPHSDKEENSDVESINACPPLKSPCSDQEENSDAESISAFTPMKSPHSDEEENSDAESNGCPSHPDCPNVECANNDVGNYEYSYNEKAKEDSVKEQKSVENADSISQMGELPFVSAEKEIENYEVESFNDVMDVNDPSEISIEKPEQPFDVSENKTPVVSESLKSRTGSSDQEETIDLVAVEQDNTRAGECIEPDSSVEEKVKPESEELTLEPLEAKDERIVTEDNAEMVPMEIGSPCSEQNELEVEKLLQNSSKAGEIDTKEQESNELESKAGIDDEKRETEPQGTVTSEGTVEQKDQNKKETRRRSRFHSPSTTWSPQREIRRERKRSRSKSKGRDSPLFSSRRGSRSRSKDRENDRDGQRKPRSRERRSRRSRSRSRGKGSSSDRNERDGYSPRRRERWNDNWRSSRGNDKYRRNDQERVNEVRSKETDEQTITNVAVPQSADKNENPDWVTERTKIFNDKSRDTGNVNESRWEKSRNDNLGDSWNRNFSPVWKQNRGRGRGRGGYRGGFGHGDQSENRWQNRNAFSGNSDNSGKDFSRFNEHRPNRRRNEQDFSFDVTDRSGWSSASSWAIRRTLPADVRNYYSRGGRNSSAPQSGWMRQEEETSGQDPNFKDQTNQQSDGIQPHVNMMQQPVNVMQQPVNTQHQPLNLFPYPMGVPPPLMNMQPSPFNMHPQMAMRLHPGVPLMQVATPANVPQGPPPPPPPPPPSQQVSFIALQPDGQQSQGASGAPHFVTKTSAPLLPTPVKVVGSTGVVQGPTSTNLPSTELQPTSQSIASNTVLNTAGNKERVIVEANADSSKKEKRLQIQEKAVQEVKLAIKPFYQNKDITKEEYKEIVRKAVEKVCHSKSGEVNSGKVANLVKAYVDKYKHSRKGGSKEDPK
ncbi:protein SCAF11 isoform X1 [Latimeria chalumnae]|uniref:SR-related CTD associated factor 11 n=1 Tax=Latimeria chalumnae TaxID=7897 RepID=H2ZVP8_LATCH|nr:PREDICTED: protein SCAF11 isoform X2 [Latimeria chalumnae]|eukprot:XP_006011649.1 PREDICTED: protein SCAF11 isoform X2 [Latimeria chalumnae]